LEVKAGPCSNATYTSLLDKRKLEEVLQATLGNAYFGQVLQGTRQVISTCGSGMTAAIIWLALRVVGVDSAIYDEVICIDFGSQPLMEI
jgi:thiosulfate/3-mercaptopyruvate sulfurtransferase